MAKYDIFISYSRQDRDVVDQICNALDDSNISYFRDIYDIAISSTFTQTLADSILSCKFVLFIGSKHSFASSYTSKEVSFAYQNHKPILPLLIDDSQMPVNYSFMFSDVQCLKLLNTPLSRLVSDIKILIDKHTTTPHDSTGAKDSDIKPCTKPKRGKRLGLIAVITLLVLAGCGTAAYFMLHNKPSTIELNYDDGYYHITGTRKLTLGELEGISSEELRIMRNEIFARHGYIFVSGDLQEYFMQKPWYKPSTKTVRLNSIEQYNILLIEQQEQKLKQHK